METLISPVRRKRNSAMDVISVSKDWRKMEILCQSHEKGAQRFLSYWVRLS